MLSFNPLLIGEGARPITSGALTVSSGVFPSFNPLLIGEGARPVPGNWPLLMSHIDYTFRAPPKTTLFFRLRLLAERLRNLP